MTTPTFPYGYQRPSDGGPMGMGTMLTWEQMLTKTTVNRLHPEVLRRFKALIHAGWEAGVPLGVGTGWRVQPDPPPAGFAAPGNSWHESCPTDPATSTALAIDTVPDISWEWMYANAGGYGLRTFRYVNNEPWHVQPAEISTSRSYATTMPALVTWELPGLEGDDDMALSDEDIERIAAAVWEQYTVDMGDDPDDRQRPPWWLLRQTKVNVDKLLQP